MGFFWALIGVGLILGLFLVGAAWTRGGDDEGAATLGDDKNQDQFPRRDLNANVNPSQMGNEADLWPDRTGARTRKELGARQAADVTFLGGREEHKGGERYARASAKPNQGRGTQQAAKPINDETAYGVGQSDPTDPAMKPGARREAAPGPHEHGPGMNKTADLAPEDEFGEDRPASRTTAPDNAPTQWHPDEHGVPGDHLREGYHRSATAPIKISDATDPYAHAPVPGPNHIPPETGQELPPDVRP